MKKFVQIVMSAANKRVIVIIERVLQRYFASLKVPKSSKKH